MLRRMTSHPFRRVAVIGSGMSGATCAQALTLAGHTVQVFDKARGPGGRLATRRMAWDEDDRRAWTTRLDHGALGMAGRSLAFRAFLDMGVKAGCLTTWRPVLAAGGRGLDAMDGAGSFHLPVPDLPALCRHLLDGTPVRFGSAVEALQRSRDGWQLQIGGELADERFDAVVLAIPPAQAAPLLAPHRADWSRSARLVEMQPCWTLMGVESVDEVEEPHTARRPWDLAAPADGPLAWVMRQDARPGRPRVAGQAHWVAHARSDWSREHLDQAPAGVQAQMLDALDAVFGRRAGQTRWQHAVVHRWRYAFPPRPSPRPSVTAPSTPACWWDADQGLGVCGDFLAVSDLPAASDGPSSPGVESAWRSGRALARQLLSFDHVPTGAQAAVAT